MLGIFTLFPNELEDWTEAMQLSMDDSKKEERFIKNRYDVLSTILLI